MGNTYRHDWEVLEAGEVREWMDVPSHHPPFKGAVSQHMRIARILLGLL
jgi:hypothetical protein